MSHRKQLPARASIDQLKRQAKDLHNQLRDGSAEAAARMQAVLPNPRQLLADAQLVIAREYGFASWPKLRRRVEAIDLADPATAFVEAACVTLDGESHRAGGVERADAILAAHPHLGQHDIFIAALLGDDVTVQRCLAADAAAATQTGGLYDWDALTYLCFSRYLRSDATRSDGFVRAARALLDHGASAATGFYAQDHEPSATFESAIYGAAGIAQHAGLTRLLLERGADPNDDETPYHVPETYDNEVLQLLVESGRLNADSLTTLLHRKFDWHDYDAVAWLLDHGADPNRMSHWGRRALHQALERDNPLDFIELLLAHGADARLANRAGLDAVATAARAGRADVLETFAGRGLGVAPAGSDAFLAACARADEAAARALLAGDATLVKRIEAEAPGTLADFAGAGNTRGVALMLDLGFDPTLTTSRAGAYNDTPLHAAIMRARHETALLLIARGAPLEPRNGEGDTPLAYAVRALVHFEWWIPHRDRTDIVAALLAAGADRRVVTLPTGAAPLDALLTRAS
jgi:ankyrin repeat protein